MSRDNVPATFGMVGGIRVPGTHNKGEREMIARFIARTHHRFQVQLSASYLGKDCAGQATVTDFSLSGWRLVGTYPVRQGTRLSLRVQLPEDSSPLQIPQAVVQWSRGHEFGVELVNLHLVTQQRLRSWACLMASEL